MSNEKLAELRHQIDAIDERLLELFNARAAVVLKVADAKREEGGKVQFYRPEREAQILRRIQETSTGPLPGADAARLIRTTPAQYAEAVTRIQAALEKCANKLCENDATDH